MCYPMNYSDIISRVIMTDLFSRNSLCSLGVLSKIHTFMTFWQNTRTLYFSRLLWSQVIEIVNFLGVSSSTRYHLVPFDSTTFHLTQKARNAVWGNSPRVRIPDSPPSRVFITDSSCEHSIFYFSYIFEQAVCLLFCLLRTVFMPGYSLRYIQPQLPVLCRLGNTPIRFRSAVFRDNLQIGSKLQFSAFCAFPFPAFRKPLI